MVRAGLVAKSRFAPRSNRAGTANRRFAFTAAVRVVVRVHNRTANGRAPTHVALTARFTDLHVLMVNVADLADGGHAVDTDVAQLAGGQAQEGQTVLLRHQLSHVAGGTRQLGALAGIELNVVDEGTDRDIGQRQSVAGLNVGACAGNNNVSDLQAVRGNDISLLAVLILNQRDKSGTVRVVLNGLYGCGVLTFWRLKSIIRYFLRLPPPRWRTVILP